MFLLNKKMRFCLFAGFLSLAWYSVPCFALPSHPSVQSGTAKVTHPNAHTMVIECSDDAVLQYEDFDVAPFEEVLFLQKSATHLIKGKQPSEILGSIRSSGKVAIMNEHGIHFGPNSSVDVGSLVVSSLDMTGRGTSSILSEGILSASEGSINLSAHHIRNLGSIRANSGDVFLTTGDVVHKDANIEQLGSITGSIVSIKLPSHTKSITARGETHDLFEADEGALYLGPDSQIKAQTIDLLSSTISLEGFIDGTTTLSKGGEVHVFGNHISLQGAKIDVSGPLGGGTVLLGGKFQGKGNTPYASKVLMDKSSAIYADALDQGDGGLVVLWSEDQTMFDGSIFARGGKLEGNGGLVETSSQDRLEIGIGKVNTLDALGNAGEWLLDPYTLYIFDTDCGLYPSNCNSTSYITPSGTETCYGNCSIPTPDNTTIPYGCCVGANRFLNLQSNLKLQAYWSICFKGNVTVTSGISGFYPTITLSCCSDGSDGIKRAVTLGDYYGHYTVNANGAKFVFENFDETELYNTFTFNTGGSDLDLGNVVLYMSESGNDLLKIDMGGGALAFTVSSANSITVTNAKSITTGGIAVSHTFEASDIPLLLAGTGSVNINADNMSLGSINAASNSSPALYLSASSSMAIGAVGDLNPLRSFTMENGSAIYARLSTVTTTGEITLLSPVTFTGVCNAGGNISFGNGAYISGIFTAGGSMTFAESVILADTTSLYANSGIIISSQISCANGANYDLTLTSTYGDILLQGDVVNLSSFTIQSANQASFAKTNLSNYTILTNGGNIVISCPTVFSANQVIFSSNGGDISLNGSCSLPSGSDLTINSSKTDSNQAGSVHLQSIGTENASLGNVYMVGGDVYLAGSLHGKSLTINNSGSIYSSSTLFLDGNFSQTLAGAMYLGASIYSGGSITFSGPLTITGSATLAGSKGVTTNTITPSSGNPSLYLNAVSYPLSVTLGGSDSQSFGSISMTASSIALQGNLYSNGTIEMNGPITISAATSFQAVGSITLANNLNAIDGNWPLTLKSSSEISVKFLGYTSFLGSVTLSGSSVALDGNIASTGSIEITGPTTVSSSSTLRGDSGIILHNDLYASTDFLDLSLQSTGGMIEVQNLGTDSLYLGSIEVPGTNFVSCGNLYSSGSIGLSGTDIIFTGSHFVAATDVSITNTNPITLPSLELALSGFFTQSGNGTVSLSGSIKAAGSIAFAAPLLLTGDTALAGSKGVTTNTITPSFGNPSLNLNAESYPLYVTLGGSDSQSFGSISIAASSIALQGDLYSSGSIEMNAPITISAASSFQAVGSITLSNPLNVSGGNWPVTLQSSSGQVSIKSLGDSLFLGSVTLTGSSVSLGGNILSTGSIEIIGPTTVSSSLILRGDSGIILHNDLDASIGSLDLSLQSTGGMIEVQNLGTDSLYLGSIEVPGHSFVSCGNLYSSRGIILSGTDIIFTGSHFVAATDVSITNTNPITLPSLELALSGFFTQSGNGTVSLSGSIKAAGSIAFAAPLLLTGDTALAGSQGITTGTITPGSSNPALTLDAGATNSLSIAFDCSENSFGILTITAAALNAQGTVASNESLQINAPITIAGATSFHSGGSITLVDFVNAIGGNWPLTLTATSGQISVQSLGNSLLPLGDVSLSGTSVYLGGNISSVGSLGISGATSISSDVTLEGTKIALEGSLLPSADSQQEITLVAIEGPISTQSLGTTVQKLKNITLTSASGSITCGNLFSSQDIKLSGTDITFTGSQFVASNDVNITNINPITLPSLALPLSGSFTQIGSAGTVSLSGTITTAGSIAFAAPLILTGDTTLDGSQGVNTGTITPSSNNPALTLNAGDTNSLSVAFGSSATNPFGTLEINASNLTLEGDLYSNSLINIDALLTISADTTLSSLNSFQGIALQKSVLANSENLYFTIEAKNGPVDVLNLGSQEATLGNVTLSGNSIVLRGSIYSSGLIDLEGTTTINQAVILQGDLGITLQNGVVPSTAPFDLTLASTSGAIQTDFLGTSAKPFKNISIKNLEGTVASGNLICSQDITLQGTSITFSERAQLDVSGNVSIANSENITLPSQDFTLTGGSFKQTGIGSVTLAGNIKTSYELSFEGDLQVTTDTNLTAKSISINGIAPAVSDLGLTLTASSSSSAIFSDLENSYPFGDVYIVAPSLVLGGDIYSSGSITIDPLLSLNFSKDSIIHGKEAISISPNNKSVVYGKALTLIAGTDISIGADMTLEGYLNITSLTKASVYNLTTTGGGISMHCPIVIKNSATFSAEGDIIFDGNLNPYASGYTLTINPGSGAILTQEIGNEKSLDQVKLNAISGNITTGMIYAGTLMINGTKCSTPCTANECTGKSVSGSK